MNSSIQIAVDILAALLTGGFLLFFIETMHIESDVKQRYKGIMNPFYHKLSKLTVFVGYLRSAIKFPEMERAKYLKYDMEYIRMAGLVPSSSGRDIPFMKSKELEKLCDVINDVWYNLDKSSDLRHNIRIDGGFMQIAKEALSEVYPEYKDKEIDVNVLQEATGDFYVRFWQPVEHCTPNYEYWEKKAKVSRILIFVALGISLLSLLVTMAWAECIYPVIPCSLAILSSLIFAVCLGMMAYPRGGRKALYETIYVTVYSKQLPTTELLDILEDRTVDYVVSQCSYRSVAPSPLPGKWFGSVIV